jgi:hemerythrin-like metal-binding protein
MLIALAQQNTNVFLIDTQHADIVDTVEHLRDTVSRRDDPGETLGVVNALLRLLRYHCRSEEWMMQLHGYPGFERHAVTHAELIGRIEQFQAELAMRKRTVRANDVDDLQTALTAHFEEWDRSLGMYLNGRGVF